MAEILIKAIDHVNANPDKDRRGAYKRGMPVVIVPDNHPWGSDERLPKFVVLKIPGVSIDRVQKYIAPQLEMFPDENGDFQIYRRRLWQLKWADLPQVAKNKLATDGELVIKAGSYSGSYDFTWVQIRNYLLNNLTGLTETEDL